MTDRLRNLTGAITVVLFVIVAASLLADGRTVFGGIVAALAAVRAVVLARDVRASMTEDDD